MINTTSVTITPQQMGINDYGENVPQDGTPFNVQGVISSPTVTESGDTLAPNGVECNAVLYVTRESMPGWLRGRDALRHAKVQVNGRRFTVVGSPTFDVPYALHPTEFYETGIPLRQVSGE